MDLTRCQWLVCTSTPIVFNFSLSWRHHNDWANDSSGDKSFLRGNWVVVGNLVALRLWFWSWGSTVHFCLQLYYIASFLLRRCLAYTTPHANPHVSSRCSCVVVFSESAQSVCGSCISVSTVYKRVWSQRQIPLNHYEYIPNSLSLEIKMSAVTQLCVVGRQERQNV